MVARTISRDDGYPMDAIAVAEDPECPDGEESSRIRRTALIMPLRPEDWPHAREVFERALALPALPSAVADDPQTRGCATAMASCRSREFWFDIEERAASRSHRCWQVSFQRHDKEGCLS